MSWFYILIVMSGTVAGSYENLYVIQEPKFEHLPECRGFVQENVMGITMLAQREFPNIAIDNVYCVTEKALKRLLVKGIEV